MKDNVKKAEKIPLDPIAVVAHEVRTPLDAMLSLTNLLSDTDLNEQQRDYVELLENAALGLQHVVTSVLDAGKPGMGGTDAGPVPFDPISLLEKIKALFTPACRQKGIEIKLQVPDPRPGPVIGDPVRLRQIINNFVNNAVKFTDQGSITIKYETDLLDDGTLQLLVSIEDTGAGIANHDLEALFQPYAQVRNLDGSHPGGTGLGLAISTMLAKLMGGNIGCRSTVGVGSTFWLDLRCTPASRQALDQFEQSHGENPSARQTLFGGLNHARILVAEDNHINRKLLSAFLERFGCHFELAENGRAAMERIHAEQFDVILMDIHMPGGNGFEILKEIKKLGGRTADIPVLALTSDRFDDDGAAYMAKGFAGVISKPIQPGLLFEKLCDAIGVADRRKTPGV